MLLNCSSVFYAKYFMLGKEAPFDFQSITVGPLNSNVINVGWWTNIFWKP